MIATIELYEVLTEALRIKDKRGRTKKFVYIATVGPVTKICPSERSASNYLEKLGFRLNDKLQWEHKYKSENEIFIEKHYRKVYINITNVH